MTGTCKPWLTKGLRRLPQSEIDSYLAAAELIVFPAGTEEDLVGKARDLAISAVANALLRVDQLRGIAKTKKSDRYTRIATLTVPEMLVMVHSDPDRSGTANVQGWPVRVTGERLMNFKVNGTTCVTCGLEGTHAIVEAPNWSEEFHINLYGADGSGNEVMLTRDHIHPKSKGGGDGLENSQPMCEPCNVRKGDSC